MKESEQPSVFLVFHTRFKNASVLTFPVDNMLRKFAIQRITWHTEVFLDNAHLCILGLSNEFHVFLPASWMAASTCLNCSRKDKPVCEVTHQTPRIKNSLGMFFPKKSSSSFSGKQNFSQVTVIACINNSWCLLGQFQYSVRNSMTAEIKALLMYQLVVMAFMFQWRIFKSNSHISAWWSRFVTEPAPTAYAGVLGCFICLRRMSRSSGMVQVPVAQN